VLDRLYLPGFEVFQHREEDFFVFEISAGDNLTGKLIKNPQYVFLI
jgi:hypothetical protein